MFNKIEGMDIVIAAFVLVIAVLAGVVIFLVNELRFYKKTTNINFDLGLKDAKIAELGLGSAKDLVRPDDFKISVEKLRKKLLEGFEKKNHPDTETLAYCILEHAGVGAYVEGASRIEIQKALTRLLLNEDVNAIRGFLSALAQSICDSVNR